MPPVSLKHLARRVVALSALACPLAAQAPADSGNAVPAATATRRAGPITIDGRLDEAAWAAATPITKFRQSQPDEGADASLATEVRILYDGDALYVGARMSEPMGAAGIRAPLARRDQLLAADGNNGSFNSLTTDKFAIALDPYHNRLDEVWFEINPAGVRGDQFNGDPSWDPVWEGAARVTAEGWTAEMRIPYSQLRFSSGHVQTWGMQLWRYVDRLNEQDEWSFRRRNESSGPAYFG
ncbi:MAG TPA: carbohydrate binding family 9 domain-containing protein, partial [Gemmatimonadaceae bacterium]|nr:carbohydrate binding family 9 domain-containing protein [Gemmatimonadaceae bacterium]